MLSKHFAMHVDAAQEVQALAAVEGHPNLVTYYDSYVRKGCSLQFIAFYVVAVQEVQALAAVEGHPNVVTYYDSWTEPAEHNQGWCSC